MEVVINKEFENLSVEDSIIADISNAVNTIVKLYDISESEVSITLTNDKAIHKLNKDYRGIDRPTDVLSFAFRESDEPKINFDEDIDLSAEDMDILGEIFISVERAKKQAEEYGHSLRREIVFLTVHGMLHLIGYDHMEEKERLEMEREQNFIMKQLGIERN